MKTTTRVLQMWIRVVGTTMIALGLLIWTGSFDQVIPFHMLLGITIVLALWVLAGLAAVSGVNLGLVALAIGWGLIVPILGLTQTQLLPGSGHWLIQVLHLLVVLGAIGQAENLARTTKRKLSEPSSKQQAHALKGMTR
jgi:hypothetical protein